MSEEEKGLVIVKCIVCSTNPMTAGTSFMNIVDAYPATIWEVMHDPMSMKLKNAKVSVFLCKAHFDKLSVPEQVV